MAISAFTVLYIPDYFLTLWIPELCVKILEIVCKYVANYALSFS